MRLRDVIKRLTAIGKAHGDVELRIYVPCVGKFETVYDIQPRRELPDDVGPAEPFAGITSSEIGDDEAQLRYDNTPFGRKTA